MLANNVIYLKMFNKLPLLTKFIKTVFF